MPCDYSKYPKNWKTEIRPRIMKRSKGKCEFCGVANYAVGTRNDDGSFSPTAGNIFHDKAGAGELNYKEAKELQEHGNDWCDMNYIIIVLTIAHLDHDSENWDVKDDRLAALCQKCHNNYDADYRKANRKETMRIKNQTELF